MVTNNVVKIRATSKSNYCSGIFKAITRQSLPQLSIIVYIWFIKWAGLILVVGLHGISPYSVNDLRRVSLGNM